MMKKLLLLACLFLALSGNAQYTTPNTGVNWSLDDLIANAPTGVISFADGIYTLSQNLTIAAADTFTIDESVVLHIDANVQVTIAGTFIANADAIVITASNTATPYDTIRFDEGAIGYLNHVSVDYGKGIRVATGQFEMQNCSMSYHVAGTTTSAALTFSTGNPLINNSTFTNNVIPAFGSGANIESAPTFSNNYLENNNTANTNRPQINMGPSGNDTIRIINNTIKGNPLLTMVGGISASSLLGNTNKVRIEGNTITDNRYGITVAGASSSGYINYNVIEDNNTQNNPALGGSGISLNASGAPTMNIIAQGNQIRRNLWGITVIGQARIDLGHADGPAIIGGGNIFADNGNNGQTYALYNNTPHPIQAQFNCWIEGVSADFEQVEDVIYHQTDDAALGLVDFTAFSSLCTLGNVAFENQLMKIYPNPNSGSFIVEMHQGATAEIYNTSGQLLFSKTLVAGENTIDFDLPSGIYLLRTQGENDNAVHKIVRR